MKKALILMLMLTVLLSFSGCKSQAAAHVDEIIEALGEITLESQADLSAARQALEALSPEDRSQVENAGILETAEAAYGDLLLKEEAEKIDQQIEDLGEITLRSEDGVRKAEKAYDAASREVQALVKNRDVLLSAAKRLQDLQVTEAEDRISAIGTVTLQSGKAITEAKKTVAALTEDAQAMVKNLNTLEKAEKALEQLIAQDRLEKNQALAAEVEEKIAAIGYVSLQSEETIAEAEKAFNALPEDAKKLVENRDQLTAARKALRDQKTNRMNSLLSTMNRRDITVDGLTYLFPQALPLSGNSWICDRRSFLLPYFVKSGNEIEVHVLYNGYIANLVYTNELTVVADQYRKNFKVSGDQRELTAVWGGVSESVDVLGDALQIEILRKVASSKNAAVRMEGNQSYYDFDIPDSDKTAIRGFLEIWDLYRELKH